MNPQDIDDGLDGFREIMNYFIDRVRSEKYPIQGVPPGGDILEITPNTEITIHNFYGTFNAGVLPSPDLPEYARALAKQKPLSYIKLGDPGSSAVIHERRIVDADEKTWTRFCDGIATSTSVKFLEFSTVRFVKFPEPIWDRFCESIAKNASLTKINFYETRLDMLPKSRLEKLCLALKSNRTLKQIILHRNFLGYMNESKFDIVFSNLFSADTSLTKLDIRQNELLYLPDNLWAKFCNYLATNTRFKTLKLDNGGGKEGVLRNKRTLELEKVLSQNTHLKELCYQRLEDSKLSDRDVLIDFEKGCLNLIENSPAHKMQLDVEVHLGSKAELNEIIWKRFCEAISKNQYLTALVINTPPKEKREEIDKMIQTKTKDRHSKTFALAHCLHKLRFKNNPIHSALHSGVISNILTFFEVKPLCEQVEIELKPFAEKFGFNP